MEATGIYSMPVYHALIEHGSFTRVLVCNAGYVKNVPDCGEGRSEAREVLRRDITPAMQRTYEPAAARSVAGAWSRATVALVAFPDKRWIDRVLLPEYGPYVTWLRPCWPSHRPVLWELSLAWVYWRRAYDRSKPSLPDAIYWHDRLLPGIGTRVDPLMASCGGNGRCRLAR